MRNYFHRRWVRLVPIYLLAIALSEAVRPVDSWTTVLGNLFFLQNDLPYFGFHVPVILSNTNIWSLNYEVVYYLLFPLLWLTPRFLKAWVSLALVVSTGGWFIPGIGAILASYAAGWLFWLAGYWLSQARRGEKVSNDEALPWPSLLLVWLAIWHMKPVWWFAHRFDLLPTTNVWMNYSYLDFIPACLCLLMVASRRRPAGYKLICILALVLPLAFMLWQLCRGRLSMGSFTVDHLFCVAALIMWRWRPSIELIEKVAAVGFISYAIYIFQRPVQWFILDATWLPQGSAVTFVLRFLIIIFLTFLVSWIAEQKFQPWIRRKLAPRPNHALP